MLVAFRKVNISVFFFTGFAPRPTRLDFDMPPLHTTSIALQNDNDKSSSSSSSAAAPTTAQGHHPSPAYHHGSHHRPASYSPTKGPAPPIPHHQHGHHGGGGGGGGPHMQSGDYDPWANATSLSPQMPSPMMQPPKPTPRTSTLQQQQQQQHQYHGSSSIDVNKNSSNNNFSVTSPAAPDHQYNNNNSNNTSRVMVNQPGQHVQQQMQMPPAAQAEPVYELEKKGHTSVIRVSYPLPSEPSVTFPTLPPSAAQDTPPIPPARRNAGNVPAAASMAAGATAMPPQLAKFPTLQIRSDSQMGLDNFKFCTVLGRGHFGKVSWRH